MRIILIILFPIIVGVAAQLSINLPLSEAGVPITGQTLAILTLAMLMRPKESLVGILLYLLLGIMGLPIFSEWGSGWNTFSGNSLGYFIGFVLSAIFVSRWAAAEAELRFLSCILAMFLGTTIILICGFLFLSFNIGWTKSLEYGVLPFIIPGLIKILFGAILVLLIQHIKIKFNNE